MSVEQEFYQKGVRQTILNTLGYKGRAHILALGGVSAVQEEAIMELPVDPRFQTRLRNADGSRNYPADYLPADEGDSE